MSKPLNVTIVRPNKTWTESLGAFVGNAVADLIRAWVLMLLVPVVLAGVHPGFWRSLAAIFAFSALFGLKDHHISWTAASKENK